MKHGKSLTRTNASLLSRPSTNLCRLFADRVALVDAGQRIRKQGYFRRNEELAEAEVLLG